MGDIMELTVNTAMPPLVKFEAREFEDRDATLEAGEFVGVAKDIIIVTPHGGRDFFEFLWEDWKRQTLIDVNSGRFPRDWFRMIEQQYRAFKNDTPTPSFGTPIHTWKHATPQVIKALKANNITTIEELATAQENTIMRLGMGSRVLHAKAKQYVEQQPISTEELIRQQLEENDRKLAPNIVKAKEEAKEETVLIRADNQEEIKAVPKEVAIPTNTTAIKK